MNIAKQQGSSLMEKTIFRVEFKHQFSRELIIDIDVEQAFVQRQLDINQTSAKS